MSTAENTTGLFKWSIDALLRRKEQSPSKKYKEQQVEETDSNTNTNNRTRSTSLNGLDPSFYNRYELINTEVRPSTAFSGIKTLMSPIKLSNDDALFPTDTFINKKKQQQQSHKDETDTSLLARLLNTEKSNHNITANSTVPIPGKFPKNINSNTTTASSQPHHNESLNQIQTDLAINKSLLLQINDYVNDLIQQNNKYKTDYHDVKMELIHEMKQCQKIMDRYTDLTARHKELKLISSDTFQMNNQLLKIQSDQRLQINAKDTRIRQLEIQINKLNIKLDEKDAQIANLHNELNLANNQLIDDRNFYELEINKLNHSLNAMDESNIINKHPTYV